MMAEERKKRGIQIVPKTWRSGGYWAVGELEKD